MTTYALLDLSREGDFTHSIFTAPVRAEFDSLPKAVKAGGFYSLVAVEDGRRRFLNRRETGIAVRVDQPRKD